MPVETQPSAELFAARQERLRTVLEKRQMPILVVSSPVNIFYLTGFHGTTGVALFESSEAVIWVDPRYTLQARDQAHGAEVIESRTGLFKAAGRWLRKRRARIAGYEDSHLSCAEFRSLERESPRTTRWLAAGGMIEQLRMVKDSYEIDQIRQAGRLTAETLTEIIPSIRPGVRESDLAAELEYRMRRKGADGAAFETIVASGARGALPHARASSKRLSSAELVIIDLGAILAGYAADMTRTFYVGRPGLRVRNLYKAVVEAQQEAVEAARLGVRAEDVDRAARRCLKRRGLADYFTHGTGHGVGLQVHERPRLGRNQKTRLRAGFVVTAEPGIYVEDLGGVRVEDTVLVSDQGPEILTPAAKEPWYIL
jgi:Xaa-Pro aminopeptidase